jgi:uncharacterized protein (DUF4415 family)
MTANKKPTEQNSPPWTDPDDAPDLSTPEWREKFAAARRGRPKADSLKISTTIRLDADILDRFRADGPGWQSRINEALRDWVTKH